MKAVKYPSDPTKRSELKNKYIDALRLLKNSDGSNKLESMQKKWILIRRRLSLTKLPTDIKKILKAEYSKLVRYYIYYTSSNISIDDKENLENIFSYKVFHDEIAKYFMNDENGFNLSVCHYCGTAYINKYSIDGEQEGLDILNNANYDDLARILRIKSQKNIQKILDNQPYRTIDQFNNIIKWRTKDKFHSVFPIDNVSKNHFDLDHVLDKGSCPITAISLMNFVPSCSVCNEKLKRSKVLGNGKMPIEELSPTSPRFDFENQVEFLLIPKVGAKIGNRPTKNANNYELVIQTKNSSYEHFINIFHLRERYQFHKMEALMWQELKMRYTDSRIALMSHALRNSAYSIKRIKSDIFQKALEDVERERCFEKLKRDILK